MTTPTDPELKAALEWALNQSYQSVAARHAKTIATAYAVTQAPPKTAVGQADPAMIAVDDINRALAAPRLFSDKELADIIRAAYAPLTARRAQAADGLAEALESALHWLRHFSEYSPCTDGSEGVLGMQLEAALTAYRASLPAPTETEIETR